MAEELGMEPEEVVTEKKVKVKRNLKIPTDPNTFRMYLRAALAVVVLVYGGCFLWEAAFDLEGENADRYVDLILGFIIGTALTTIIAFYFGSSEGNGSTVLKPKLDL